MDIDEDVREALPFEAEEEGGMVTVTFGKVVAENGADWHWSMYAGQPVRMHRGRTYALGKGVDAPSIRAWNVAISCDPLCTRAHSTHCS